MSKSYEYSSGLSVPIRTYITEKRSLGRKYDKESRIFCELDRYLVKSGVHLPELSQAVVEGWIMKRPNEKRKNQRYRLNFIKRFALYLKNNGYEAYRPALKISSNDDADFVPYIFTNDELDRLLHYFDNLNHSNQYPKGHLVTPLLFRTLICYGLRVSEAINLKLGDVDLGRGILLISEAKNEKKRYVPLSEDVWERFRFYYHEIHENSTSDDCFFPNARRGPHHPTQIYNRFREALWHCGIEHKGRGYGPRVHDFRHTFAVRSMQKLEKTKGDIVTSLPYLSTYLGHSDIMGSQLYLRLISEHHPELIEKLCNYLGDTIPTWEANHNEN